VVTGDVVSLSFIEDVVSLRMGSEVKIKEGK